MEKRSIFDRMVDLVFFTIYPKIRKPFLKARIANIDSRFHNDERDNYQFDTYTDNTAWISEISSFVEALLKDSDTPYFAFRECGIFASSRFATLSEFSDWLQGFVDAQDFNLDAVANRPRKAKSVDVRYWLGESEELPDTLKSIVTQLKQIVFHLQHTDLKSADGQVVHIGTAFVMVELVALYVILRKTTLEYNPLNG